MKKRRPAAQGDLTAGDTDALLRWRLALGPGAEKVSPTFAMSGLEAGMGELELSPPQAGELDDALSFVYDEKTTSAGRARPYIPKWLGALREFFREDIVALVQKDAIERKGLTELLFE